MTETPSSVITHVRTPARSARGEARSSCRRASTSSPRSLAISRSRPASSARVASCALSRSARSLLQLDGRLRRGELGLLQEFLREQPLARQLLVALQLRFERGQLQCLHVGPAFDVDEALLQREPLLHLRVGLDRQVLRQFVDREPRLADVELKDRLAGGQLRARAFDDAQHAGLDRAGDHLLDFRHHHARRADGGVDRAALDDRRADGVAAQAGGEQSGQPEIADDGQRQRRAADARRRRVWRRVTSGSSGRSTSGVIRKRGAMPTRDFRPVSSRPRRPSSEAVRVLFGIGQHRPEHRHWHC